MAQWSAWSMFLPFIAAPVWWAWSDASGRTRRLQEERFEQRRRARRQRAVLALGGPSKASARKGR
jgi:small Trp-rich protein